MIGALEALRAFTRIQPWRRLLARFFSNAENIGQQGACSPLTRPSKNELPACETRRSDPSASKSTLSPGGRSLTLTLHAGKKLSTVFEDTPLDYFSCGSSAVALRQPRVVIISPHNEAIRYEFGRGFDQCIAKNLVKAWRSNGDMGGTADCLRFVQSEFATKPGGIGLDIFSWRLRAVSQLADNNLALSYEPPKEVLSGIPQSLTH